MCARVSSNGDELTAAEEIRVQEIQALADTSATEALGKSSGSVVKVTRAAALGADDNYVTDAEKVVIGNTSGTNTGDNAANSNYASDYRPGGTDVAIADGGTGASTAVAAMAALAFQSRARAYRSTAQTITTGTFTKVQLNSEDYDILGEFDSTTNYRFTKGAGDTATYHIDANVYLDASSGGSLIIIDVRKNNSSILYKQEPMSTVARAICGSTDIELAANDYVELFVYHDSGANRDVYASGNNAFTYMNIRRVA